jgi:ribonuclease P protein component
MTTQSLHGSSTPPQFSEDRPRLRKHADYQRVYKSSRKHFSSTMAYFYSLRNPGVPPALVPRGPRVGLTAGKVLGNAVERNRIKRRMREAVRHHVALLQEDVDVILHPRKTVLTIEFGRLDSEVERIFTLIQQSVTRGLQGELPETESRRRAN